MSTLLSIAKRNAVLSRMATLLEEERASLKSSNQQDLDNYSGADLAMEKRLLVDDTKIDGMILSMQQLASQEDPIGVERFHFVHEKGMKITNKMRVNPTYQNGFASRTSKVRHQSTIGK